MPVKQMDDSPRPVRPEEPDSGGVTVAAVAIVAVVAFVWGAVLGGLAVWLAT